MDIPQSKPLHTKALDPTVGYVGYISPPSEKTENLLLSYLTEPEEFAEQIRKTIANFDRPLAIQVTRALKDKLELRGKVRATLTVDEFDNFRLLVTAGFIRGTQVKYIGDPKYAEQYEGLELKVHSMDAYSQIACLKPDGSLTTWLKPEELEKL